MLYYTKRVNVRVMAILTMGYVRILSLYIIETLFVDSF